MDDPSKILEQVRPCLQQWNINARDIKTASHSENIVYHVLAEDKREYALRVHRPGYHTLAELESEQLWTDALSRFGISVPAAVKTHKGDYFTSVDCDGSTRYVGLVHWLEGRPLSELSFSPEDLCGMLSSLGQICARMHNQASAWCVPPGFERHHLNVDGFFGEAPFWGRFWEVPDLTTAQRDLVLVAREKIIDQLTAYGENQQTYSMIHADLHHQNLMVNDERLTVFDFDDAGFGWHQYDLAVALHEYRNRENFDELKSSIIQGYRQERSISDGDLALLPLFLLVRNLALIGWAHERPELGRSDYKHELINDSCRDIVNLGLVAGS
jgi:Ser/Thr protein kinase RdoA (MazF antagonist)